MLAEAKEQGLEKTLGVWDLIILGVGAIIGSGIFCSCWYRGSRQC